MGLSIPNSHFEVFHYLEWIRDVKFVQNSVINSSMYQKHSHLIVIAVDVFPRVLFIKMCVYITIYMYINKISYVIICDSGIPNGRFVLYMIQIHGRQEAHKIFKLFWTDSAIFWECVRDDFGMIFTQLPVI